MDVAAYKANETFVFPGLRIRPGGVVGLEPNGRAVLGTTVHLSIETTRTFGSCNLKTNVPGSWRSWKHARPKVHYKNT